MSTTVTSVTPSTQGALGAGATLSLTVGMSAAVTVSGGTPTLTLNDGGTAVYDAAATAALGDPTQLVFDYTVGTTDTDVAQLAIVGGSPQGATIVDAVGNVPDFTGLFTTYSNVAGVATDVNAPATVTAVAASRTGYLAVGQSVAITLTLNQAVTVSGGTPTLTLNTGGVATYDAAATAALKNPDKLVFDYTVGATDTQQRYVDFVGGSLNGATIADAHGNTPDFSPLYTNTSYVISKLGFSTTTEQWPGGITGVTYTAPDGSALTGPLGAGQSVHINVGLQYGVTVTGGTPTLTLNDGGTATYDATASTATNLVFDYTVGATDRNVPFLVIVAGSTGGAVIVDGVGLAPNLSSLFATYGTYPYPGPAVLIQAPTVVTSVTTSVTGEMQVGQSVQITLTMSNAVTVTGSGKPTIKLNDGGTATYDAAATAALDDPSRMVFDYTVGTSDKRADQLSIVGGGGNGGATITDANGNVPDFSALFSTFANLPGLGVYQPTNIVGRIVNDVGVFRAGDTTSFTLEFDQAVKVDGTPTLALNNGGTAVYDANATAALDDPTKVVFDYTVGATDQAKAPLDIIGSGFGGGGSVVDSFGLPVNFSSLSTHYAQILAGIAVSIGPDINFNGSADYGAYAPVFVDASGDIFTDGIDEFTPTATGYTGPTLVAPDSNSTATELKGGLIADASGDLFGVAQFGGLGVRGINAVVFELAKTATGYASTLTPIASTTYDAQGTLVMDASGDLFGIGGNSSTIFEVVKTASGYAKSTTQIASFAASTAGLTAGLVIDGNGDLFGVSQIGGAGGKGFVYELVKTAGGYNATPAILTSFNGTDGATPAPTAPLLIDANGDLFGTTYAGGASGYGTVFELAKTASGYAASPTTLVSFSGPDGAGPASNLLMDAAGDVFGSTASGGDGYGTVFEIAKTASGYASSPTLLSWFDGANGGAANSLFVDGQGNLFGYSTVGGPYGYGTSFEVKNTGFFVTQAPGGASDVASRPAGIDLASIAFGADTTLAYAANSDNSGGSLSVTDGAHSATIALIGQYAAANFALASDSHGGTLVSDPSLSGAALTAFLASPHT
ncbi:MAG: hypothetical protein P4M07_09220 [Xanthobacteraceae bacterium]|nr:hypothetical protein [Xanthobacteraceae bacterium]